MTSGRRTGNSILDEIGDVVLYAARDGSRHLFRDGHPDGLRLRYNGDGTCALHLERDVEVDGRFGTEVDDEPLSTMAPDGRDWVVRTPRRVIVRADTVAGALAKAARVHLRLATA